MVLTLKPLKPLRVLVEAENLSPDRLAGLSHREIENITVNYGSRQVKLKELFRIEGEMSSDPAEAVLRVVDGYGKICRLGEKMKAGKIEVEGSTGHYLGRWMEGGEIEVHGSVRSYAGCEMRDGKIEIYGNAGPYLGGRLRGKITKPGMRKGLIIVHGSAGARAGYGMAGGAIIIEGSAGVAPGAYMSGGKIMVKGDCQGLPGAGMTGGTIIICGAVGSIPPSFYPDSTSGKAKAKGVVVEAPFIIYVGDAVENPKCMGRLYINLDKNPWARKHEELIS